MPTLTTSFLRAIGVEEIDQGLAVAGDSIAAHKDILQRQKGEYDPLLLQSKDLLDRRAYLAADAPALTGISEAVGKLNTAKDSEDYAEEELDETNFKAASGAVGTAITDLRDANTKGNEAVAAEEKRRTEELKRLLGAVVKLAPETKAKQVPLRLLANGLELKNEIETATLEAKTKAGLPAPKRGSYDEFQGAVKAADEAIVQLQEKLRVAGEASAKARGERNKAVAAKRSEYDTLRKKYEEACDGYLKVKGQIYPSRVDTIEKIEGDFKKAIGIVAFLPHDQFESKVKSDVDTILDKLAKVTAEIDDPRVQSVAASNVKAKRGEVEQPIAGKLRDIKDVFDRLRSAKHQDTEVPLAKKGATAVPVPKPVAVTPEEVRKRGVGKAVLDLQAAIDDAMNKGEGTKAEGLLQDLDALVKESADTVDAVRKSTSGAIQLINRFKSFPESSKLLKEMVQNLRGDAETLTPAQLKARTAEIDNFVIALANLERLYMQALDGYQDAKDSLTRAQKTVELKKLEGAMDAVRNCREKDPALTRTTEAVKNLRLAVLEANKPLKNLEDTVKDAKDSFADLPGDGTSDAGPNAINSELTRLREKGQKNKDYETIQVELDTAKAALDQFKSFSGAAKQVQSDKAKVSKFQDFAAGLDSPVNEITKRAEAALLLTQEGDNVGKVKGLKDWKFSDAKVILDEATRLIASFAPIGALLEEAKPHFDKVKGGAAQYLAKLILSVKGLASAESWEPAAEEARLIKTVALAAISYEVVYNAAEARLKDAQKSLSVDPALKPAHDHARVIFDTTARPAENNRAGDVTIYTTTEGTLNNLTPVFEAMKTYAAEYKKRATALAGVLKMYPTTYATGPTEDIALTKDLKDIADAPNANVLASVTPYSKATGLLPGLDGKFANTRTTRMAAVQEDMKNSVKGKALEKTVETLCGTDAGKNTLADLYRDLGGKTELEKLLNDMGGGAGDVTSKTALGTGLGQIGGAGIVMMRTKMGSNGHLAALMKDKGDTSLLKGVHDKFKDNPDDLGKLVTESFGGDARALKGMAHNVCGGDPTKFNGLVDTFAGDKGRPQLKELVDAFGPENCGPQLGKLVTNRYGRDPKKLKTVLYDKVYTHASGKPEDRKKLFKAAPRFEKKAPVKSDLNVNKKKFGSVRAGHFLERHLPENFDFGNDKNGVPIIKKKNTQWPATLTKADMRNALQQAIDKMDTDQDVNNLENGDRLAKELLVNLPLGTLQITIGVFRFPDGGLQIDSFFPMVGGTVAVDEFTKDEMNVLKNVV